MLHFIEVLDLDILNVAVDVDNNSNSYRCFCCTHPNSKQGKEETFQLSWEEEAIEYPGSYIEFPRGTEVVTTKS